MTDIVKGHKGKMLPKIKVIDANTGEEIRMGYARESDFMAKHDNLITPFILLCIASIFGTIAWGGSQILSNVKDTVTDIKADLTVAVAEQRASDQKLWDAFTDNKKCVNNDLVRCCKGADVC